MPYDFLQVEFSFVRRGSRRFLPSRDRRAPARIPEAARAREIARRTRNKVERKTRNRKSRTTYVEMESEEGEKRAGLKGGDGRVARGNTRFYDR